jgi:hypothetical protein
MLDTRVMTDITYIHIADNKFSRTKYYFHHKNVHTLSLELYQHFFQAIFY